MKTTPKTYAISLFLLIFVLIFCNQAISQTDSIKTEYSEESKVKSDFTFKEKYRYFTRANVAEKTLIKIGGNALNGGWGGKSTGFVGTLTNVISVEQKLMPPLSVLIEAENNWHSTGKQHNGYSLGLNVGIRWYYDLNKRIREGKTANNFSNPYLSVQSNNYLYQSEKAFTNNSSLSLLFGSQVRLGRFGYVDTSLGPNIRFGNLEKGKNRFNFEVNISIGFAFNLF